MTVIHLGREHVELRGYKPGLARYTPIGRLQWDRQCVLILMRPDHLPAVAARTAATARPTKQILFMNRY